MTTTEPTGPQLWQRLVQWQPAEAALLAQHIRALPNDWPLRVFGVGRPDAALLLPPGASGEQYPDRAPEIAPFDEIADLEDCPACEEAEGLCRWHEGFAAAHQAQTQAQLEAVKARPEISLREFLHWQADVAEAEDRGEEPPLLPAASPPAVWSDGDPLMQAIARAVYARCETGDGGIVHDDPRNIAAAAAPVARALIFHKAAEEAQSCVALFDGDEDEEGAAAAGAVEGLADRFRRMAAEPPLSPYYSHEACGFHWHGRDGMDIPMRDGQPVCPRCELRRVADEQPTTTKTETEERQPLRTPATRPPHCPHCAAGVWQDGAQPS